MYPPHGWDLLSLPDSRAIRKALESSHAVISYAYLLPDFENPDEVLNTEWIIDWIKNYVDPAFNAAEPISDIYYPVFESSKDSVLVYEEGEKGGDASSGYDQNGNKLVALMADTFYWSDVIRDVLPVYSNGLVVVFENECNPTFTYQINGKDAVFLGRGDKHDSRYDKYMLHSKIRDLPEFQSLSKTYTGVPIDEDFCPFNVKIYPSRAYEREFKVASPTLVTVLAILVFGSLSVLVVYSQKLNELRQQRLMETAAKRKAMVVNLFPQSVHDRLFRDQEANIPKRTINRVLNVPQLSGQKEDEDLMFATKPIADLFPGTWSRFDIQCLLNRSIYRCDCSSGGHGWIHFMELDTGSRFCFHAVGNLLRLL